jgi:hypothetical protein
MYRSRIIDYIREKIKLLAVLIDRRDVFSAVAIIMSAGTAFFLGRITHIEAARPPVVIRQFPAVTEPIKVPRVSAPTPVSATATAGKAQQGSQGSPPAPKGLFVASKTGKKYQLPTCLGAKNIAEAKKIWFASKEEAEKAGYTPAANCNGM